jgi:hypothetical protein
MKSPDDAWLDVETGDQLAKNDCLHDEQLDKTPATFGSNHERELIPDSLRLFLSKIRSSAASGDGDGVQKTRKKSTPGQRKLSRLSVNSSSRKMSGIADGPGRKVSTLSTVSNFSDKMAAFDGDQFVSGSGLKDILGK